MTTVGVTAAGGGVGIAIIKALRMVGAYRVIGFDPDPSAAGLYLADQGHLIPHSMSSGYLEKLGGMCNALDIDVLFPGCDPELLVISGGQRELQETAPSTSTAISDFEAVLTCRDKFKFAVWTSRNAHVHDAPWTSEYVVALPEHPDPKHTFPMILRPTRGSGSRGVHVIPDRRAYDRIAGSSGFVEPHILQDYIEGQEYTVTVVRCGAYTTLACVLARGQKLGPYNQMVPRWTVYEPEIAAAAKAIADQLQIEGPCNVQLIRADDGTIYPFEVNARFPGSTICCAMAGFNGPAILADWYTEDQIPLQPPIAPGLRIVRGLSETAILDYEIARTTENGSTRC